MPTASTINFLQPDSVAPAVLSGWGRFCRKSLGGQFTSPVLTTQACFGQDGAFIFDAVPYVSNRVKIAAGMIAVLSLGWLSPIVYPFSQASFLAAKTMTLPTISLTQHPQLTAAAGTVASRSSIGTKVEKQLVSSVPPKTSTIAPVAPNSLPSPSLEYSLRRDVFAFLPYWFVGKTSTLHYDKLSTLAYFGIEVNADGSLNRQEPGWTTLYSPAGQQMIAEVKKHQTRLVMTYRAFNADQIAAIVADAGSRERAVTNMVNQAKEVGAAGANIDFENAEHPNDALRANFTAFVALATARFHQQIPGSEVTVSTYAAAAKFYKLYDVAALAPVSDGLFMMAYDYYTVNSGHAGPVAPLNGYPGTYWYDVTTAVKDYIAANVPANKIILGVPYYGYDWPVVQNKAGAEVGQGSANTSSYKGSIDDTENTSATKRWDEVGQVPYYTYWQDGSWRITYYDDAQSLAKKYDLVNQFDLKGAGIWALGQEGDAQELWQLLAAKFGQPKT